MEKIAQYRELVQEVLSTFMHTTNDGESQAIFDTVRDHYQIVQVGWRKGWYRDYGTLIHVDIKDGKIWIQQDGTKVGVASLFVERGFPKSDIVLAFHAPYKRQFTEFATA